MMHKPPPTVLLGLTAALLTLAAGAPGDAFAQRAARSAQRPAPAAPAPQMDRTRGASEAPAALRAAGVACTVSEAAFLGVSSATVNGVKADQNLYEAACQEGLGYLLLQAPTKTEAYDCVTVETSFRAAEAKGQTAGALRCRLPANAQPARGLQPLLTRAGVSCTPANARYMGDTSAGSAIYEVSCASGPGYVLQRPRSGSGAPMAMNCIRAQAGGEYACELTPRAAAVAGFSQVAAQAQRRCAVSDVRFLGLNDRTSSDVYEIGCGSSAGFVAELTPQGAFRRAFDCGAYPNVKCALSDTAVVTAAQREDFGRQIRATGFDCAIGDFRYLGKEAKTLGDLVEVSCSNRPDGAIALLGTSGQQSTIYDCLLATTRVQACTLTQPAALYPRLSSGVNAKAPRARAACNVNAARYAGTSQGQNWVEVGCADGRSYMIDWRGQQGVQQVLTCRDAQDILGGCRAGAGASRARD